MAKSDTGPFALVPEWVLDLDVSDRAVRLYAILARYADKDGEAWPSRTLLAERLRCSRDSVDRAVAELVAAGGILCEHRRSSRKVNLTNLYHVRRLVPAEIAAEPRPPSRMGAQGSPQGCGRELEPEEPEPVNETAEQAPPSCAKKKPRARSERDAYFTALESAFGPASTGSRGSFYGKAVTQVMEAAGKPEDIIRARVAMSRRGWDHPTPEAMLKHWDDLLTDTEPRARARARPLDHYDAVAERDMASRRGAG